MKTLLICLLLTGCVTPYLTADEEASLKKACEPAHDCVVLTGPQWKAIRQFIAIHSGTAI
jgi:hypothetical protein